ncbi:MAG: ABC transporter permease subunit [Planctomycetaceae bacterium]|nr:ABC transporter permease subunit [Planctomycetaceae bacterium]
MHTLSLPLLTKELLEQSARRRTYVIRTLYAALLFLSALFIFYITTYQHYTSPLDILGRGREVFDNVVALQFFGIFMFMPAITCSVIAGEKERNTFGLLLLTRLSPTTILLEKLLSRLVPMLSFLLLSLPLLGVSYAMGGVSQGQFWISIWALFLTAVQVGTMGLACSAWFRTTVQAFVGTYVCGFLFYFGWPILTGVSDIFSALNEAATQLYVAYVNLFARAVWPFAGASPSFEIHHRQFTAALIPPAMLIDRYRVGPGWWAIPHSVPSMLSVIGLFVMARVFVVRRAFAPSRNMLLNVFKVLDTSFHRLNNNRVTKGVVLFNEAVVLPDDDPIAWRETRKKSLGMLRYLIRFWVATEIPVLILCCSVVVLGSPNFYSGASEAVSAVLFVAWIMAALLITVKSATLISGERSHETLDVLLATPIRSAEIVRQKFRGVRRLMLVLACPLLTIVLFQTYFRISIGGVTTAYQQIEFEGDESPVLYVLAAVSSIAIYLPLLAWIGFAIGLVIRSQTRAIFSALALVTTWCIVPFLLGVIVHEELRWFRFGDSPANFLLLLSPISIVAFSEFSDLEMFYRTPYEAVLVNCVLYGGLLYFIRNWCLRNAAAKLGRGECRDTLRQEQQRHTGFGGLSRRRGAPTASTP